MDPAPLVTSRRDGPVVQVSPQGDLDIVTAPAFEEAVLGHVADGARRGVVSLAEVGLVDSSGLRALLRSKAVFEDVRGSLRLRELRPWHRRLLQITGLDRIFDVLDAQVDPGVDLDRTAPARFSSQAEANSN